MMATGFEICNMKSNSFGKYFGFTAFGESHGQYMGLVIEDVLPNIEFPYRDLQIALEKRRPGQAEYTSQRKENDDFEVISGVFEGKTTGMPICILFKNNDFRSEDYEFLRNQFRAAHADFSWFQKYKIYDFRGGGRASGRETISRVAAGAFIKNILGNILINVYPIKIGHICIRSYDESFKETNSLSWCCPDTYDDVSIILKSTQDELDSLGAIVEAQILNIPAGLGDPVFEKLDANLAKAILSIGGVRGIEFGSGFELSEMKGSEAYLPHHQGGILGGVSDGNTIKLRIALKPISSIGKPVQNLAQIKGRHDTCLVPRILSVIESMIQLVLADAIAHQDLISSKEKDLNSYREALDKIDEDLIISLYRRFEISKNIGVYKNKYNLPVFDENRENEIYSNIFEIADELDLSLDLVKNIWSLILDESKKRQSK